MTIAARNRLIRIAAFFSLALVVVTIICITLTVLHKNLPQTAPGVRPFPELTAHKLTAYSPFASMVAISAFPFFALLGLCYILFAFEKTQTVEITFFAACLFASSLEAFRIFIPYYALWNNTVFYASAISRIAYFSRILTLLLLLSSSIYTTGQAIQQIGASIFLLTFFLFGLTNAIPVNTGSMS
jgi:hypothetical protein